MPESVVSHLPFILPAFYKLYTITCTFLAIPFSLLHVGFTCPLEYWTICLSLDAPASSIVDHRLRYYIGHPGGLLYHG